MSNEDTLSKLSEIAARLASSVLPDGEVLVRLLGRAPGKCSRQMQLFAAVSTTFAEANYVPIEDPIREASDQFVPSWRPNGERLWRVRSAGLELQRSSGDGVAPLTQAAIVSGPTATQSRGGSSVFKIRVDVTSDTGNYFFDMDCGQPVEVYGKTVAITVLGPSNAFVVHQGNETETLSGVLVDALLSTAINAAEESLGQTEVHLTQHFAVAANTQVAIPVPQRARGLQVYTGVGPNPAQWIRHIGDPLRITNTLQVGTVDFAGANSVLESSPVGDETHILTDIDVNNARFFTVVWTIKP